MVSMSGKIQSLKMKCKLTHIGFKLFEWTIFCLFFSVNVVFITKDGERVPIRGKVGDNLLYLAHRYEIPMEGACEASLGNSQSSTTNQNTLLTNYSLHNVSHLCTWRFLWKTVRAPRTRRWFTGYGTIFKGKLTVRLSDCFVKGIGRPGSWTTQSNQELLCGWSHS